MKNNNFTNKNQVVEVYIGDDCYVNFTLQSYKKFKEQYESALADIIENNLDINDYAIISEYGDVIILSYAKYVIQFLEIQFLNI